MRNRPQRADREPKPRASVFVVKGSQCDEISALDLTPEKVGWKAYGLAALPADWSSPFFVVDLGESPDLCYPKAEAIEQCAKLAGVNTGREVLVRSSGTQETLSHRGSLSSRLCSVARSIETIKNLTADLSSHEGRVHWVIQEYHAQRCKGHFSNERRISKEQRDWLVETEPRGGYPTSVSPVAVRFWRDGTSYDEGILACNSEMRISVCLKQVAMWAHQFGSRLHFEWLWDGKRVFLVQLDKDDALSGVTPREVLPKSIPSVDVDALRLFRFAAEDDFNSYSKLSNAAIYRKLGYDMPSFYVLVRPDVIRNIVDEGVLPHDVRKDLDLLTRRPLIIRTDGIDIPASKREMLPRSDELRSGTDAESWLVGSFRRKITESDLVGCGLILIAHHYIPSIASAWARSEPASTFVRIEALWGIPEGIYWFSHDTFEVDIGSSDPLTCPYEGAVLPVRRRTRHKSRFVAPDERGQWIPHKTASPYDWRSSITNKAWLSEIAWTTRRIAQVAKEASSVMWFVGNHPRACQHRILPWFHSKSELDTPKAVPRRKFRSASEITIRTVGDWEALKLAANQARQIERVLIEPTDSELIRNPVFAKDLAALAGQSGFVVELSGGILSHAYYVLRRHNVKVECVDLFGGDEDVAQFYKIVRDEVPNVILSRGERASVVRLAGDALIVALKQKLVEEAYEALDTSSGEELVGELADVAEVIRALSQALCLEQNRISKERKAKLRKRGGFEKGYLLTRTSTPYSLATGSGAPGAPDDVEIFSDPLKMPSRPAYRRPDLRQVGERKHEKLLTIEVELNRPISGYGEPVSFDLPNELRAGPVNFLLGIELTREGAILRSTARVRLAPTQLVLQFALAEGSEVAPK